MMSSTLLTEAPHWQSQHHPLARSLNAQWRSWLFDRGSLTQRLIELSHDQFRVRVLREDWRCPMPWELHALDLPTRHFARVREVVLLCEGQPLVYARSVLPVSSLIGKNRHFKYLGNRPLGAALFSEPTLKRDPIAIAPVYQLRPAPSISHQHPAYARCSVFYVHEKPLLVSEIFLPEIITYTGKYD